MRAVIDELLKTVHERWQARGGDREAFPAAAEAALVACKPWERLSGSTILDALGDGHPLPDQPRAGVGAWGDPKVVLARDGGVEVIAYFMRYPRFDAHSHGFVGAFTVLEGQSVHVPRTFVTDAPQSEPVLLGEVVGRRHELIRPGDVRPILDGFGLCHIVAHVTYPTVSFVISANPAPHGAKMRSVLDTGVSAWADEHLSPRGFVDLGLLEHLYAAAPDPAQRVGAMVRRADDLHAYWYAVYSNALGEAPETVAGWLDERGEAWTDRLVRALEPPRDRQARWSAIPDTDDRLLLVGALAGVPPGLLLEWLPGGPEKAVERLGRLCGAGSVAFELEGAAQAVLEAMLAGGSSDDAVRSILRQFDVDDPAAVESDVALFVEQARRNPVLQGLVGAER